MLFISCAGIIGPVTFDIDVLTVFFFSTQLKLL